MYWTCVPPGGALFLLQCGHVSTSISQRSNVHDLAPRRSGFLWYKNILGGLRTVLSSHATRAACQQWYSGARTQTNKQSTEPLGTNNPRKEPQAQARPQARRGSR